MQPTLCIGVLSAVFVLRTCEPKRIDDARVTFLTMNEKRVADWNAFFENINLRQNKMEKCETFSKNIVASAIIDIAPCIEIVLTTRLQPGGTKLSLGGHDQLRESGYNSSNRLIMIVHGFFQNPRDNWMEDTRNALLKYGDFNVVVVDWNALSMQFYYPRVVQNAMKVAEYLALFIDFFVDAGTHLENVHIVGHSLGAHLAGVASHKATKGIVGRITGLVILLSAPVRGCPYIDKWENIVLGLDAARPLFLAFEDDLKLEKSDAHFVDCIHTSGGFVGMPIPFCHADFFANGGRVQPGCPEFISLGRCGHLRATKYFIETISDKVRYKAYKCATMSHADPVTCWEEGGVMGYPANKSHQGIFYVETGVRPPYHTASSKRELEQADVDSLNPIVWVAGKIDIE